MLLTLNKGFSCPFDNLKNFSFRFDLISFLNIRISYLVRSGIDGISFILICYFNTLRILSNFSSAALRTPLALVWFTGFFAPVVIGITSTRAWIKLKHSYNQYPKKHFTIQSFRILLLQYCRRPKVLMKTTRKRKKMKKRSQTEWFFWNTEEKFWKGLRACWEELKCQLKLSFVLLMDSFTRFFLLEHLNFGWAWMCLFFSSNFSLRCSYWHSWFENKLT